MFVYVETEVPQDTVGAGGAGIHDVGMEGAAPNWKESVGSDDREEDGNFHLGQSSRAREETGKQAEGATVILTEFVGIIIANIY